MVRRRRQPISSCIGTVTFTGLQLNKEWSFGAGKASSRITLAPRLEINDALAAIAAAEAGEGITVALSYMVAKLIKARRLVAVLEVHGPPPVPVHLVYPESRVVAPKLRAFLDHAAPRLRVALRNLDLAGR